MRTSAAISIQWPAVLTKTREAILKQPLAVRKTLALTVVQSALVKLYRKRSQILKASRQRPPRSGLTVFSIHLKEAQQATKAEL